MKNAESTFAAIVMAAFFCLLAAGCTELERNGVSPIPQNSPCSWEMSPFGGTMAN